MLLGGLVSHSATLREKASTSSTADEGDFGKDEVEGGHHDQWSGSRMVLRSMILYGRDKFNRRISSVLLRNEIEIPARGFITLPTRE